MIIDAHVYCLPPHLSQLKSCELPNSEDAIKESIYKHKEGNYALSLSSIDAILKSMKMSRIKKSALVSIPWKAHHLCMENNKYIIDITKKYDCFFAIVSIQPTYPASFKDAINLLNNGAIGIKLNSSWQDFEILDNRLDRLWRAIEDRGKFVMLHIDHLFKYSQASAYKLLELAIKRPNLKILATHMGGMLGIYNLHEPVRNLINNIWFDTAVSSTLKMIKFYVESGLEDKIIFGSDFPFNHSHEQKQLVEEIKKLIPNKQIRKKIFSDNFLNLIQG